MQPGGLWQRHRRCPSQLSFAKQKTTRQGTGLCFSTGIPVSYPRTSLRGYSGGVPEISFPPPRLWQRKKKKTDTRKTKGKTQKVNILKAGLLLLHALPLSLGSTLDLRPALLDALGLRIGSLLLLLPPWWGRRPPPPCCMLGNPLGLASIRPRSMRASAVRALCRSVWAHAAVTARSWSWLCD